jgi:hypothetical protein
MSTSVRLSGIVAKISAEAMVDTGSGMATWWKYPCDMREIMPLTDLIRKDSPMPLYRLTVFDSTKLMLSNGKTPFPSCEYMTLDATVEHLSYGTMIASDVIVTGVATEN